MRGSVLATVDLNAANKTGIMETPNDNILLDVPRDTRTATPLAAPNPAVADSAMATGTDEEPEMTIADKHIGEPTLDPDGDGELTPSEAATLLGDSNEEN